MANPLENAKTVVELIRDLFIGIFIGLIFFSPGCINTVFKRAGITKAEWGGLTWQAGGEISSAKLEVQDVTASLTELKGKTKDPAAQETLQKAIEQLKVSQASLNSADQSIKSSVEQKSEAQPAQPSALQGWMFLGHVTEPKTTWIDSKAHKPSGDYPALNSGQKLVTSDTIYLRAPTAPGQHATGQVIGVIPSGSTIEVLEIDTSSHALQGGWFVWARVRPV